jgi:hypothetical protein
VVITGGFSVYQADVEGGLVHRSAVHEAIISGTPDEARFAQADRRRAG